MELFYTTFSSPVGRIGLASTEKGLCQLRLNVGEDSDFKNYLKTELNIEPIKKPKALTDVKDQLNLYFSGKHKKFSCDLDICGGTEFQRQVWKKLLNIPYGKTWSYKCLAGAVKNPKANRAVGNANGKNRISIIIPCHRVIRRNGDLGGYGGGTKIKQFLLDLEKKHYASL
ncbi:MAG: methylated-DNA--[protein]-cysteine S-methyltransferase [Nitrospinales bacterium]